MAKVAKIGGRLAIDEVWQSVALEERLELISKSQASGILASVVTTFLIGSIAYGLDEIWLLAVAVGGAFFSFPLFSSQTWRTGKPSLILAYLAVRTVARRYAFSYDLPNIDIILIYRGQMKEIFNNESDTELNKQKQTVDFDSVPENFKSVWIILMRSGVLLLSERRGGAKLEFLSPIIADTKIKDTEEEVYSKEMGSIIVGSGMSKDRKIILKSRYRGAHYVFKKRFEELVGEAVKAAETVENLRKKNSMK